MIKLLGYLFCIIGVLCVIAWVYLLLIGAVHPGYWTDEGYRPPGFVKGHEYVYSWD